jgi:hypothetical protein
VAAPAVEAALVAEAEAAVQVGAAQVAATITTAPDK